MAMLIITRWYIMFIINDQPRTPKSDPRVTAVLQLPGGALRPVGNNGRNHGGFRIYVSLPQDYYGAIYSGSTH